MPFAPFLRSVGSEIIDRLRDFGIADALDIIFMAFVLYKLIQIVRETKAGQLVKAIILFVAIYLIAQWIGMPVVVNMMGYIFRMGLIVVAVLFQPELRRAMEKLGRSNVGTLKGVRLTQKDENLIKNIDIAVKVCADFGRSKTGALIVFEQTTPLGEAIESGTALSAKMSDELLLIIFYKEAPMHDGAVIIRDNKIYAAGCILPLSKDDGLNKDLGTRHRAAIGVTEDSDAVAIIVSEESGIISAAKEGKIERDLNAVSLKQYLLNALIITNETDRSILGRIRNLHKKKRVEEKINENPADEKGGDDNAN